MYDQDMAARAAENLRRVREGNPLVHNITNYVVMNYSANALLACGASPVMAHAVDEVEEMVSLAGALVLNIGTLSPPWIAAMIKAGKRANELHVPVILDPVGAGATTLRTDSAKRIIEGMPRRSSPCPGKNPGQAQKGSIPPTQWIRSRRGLWPLPKSSRWSLPSPGSST
jgi:hypothetical protein